MTAMTKRNLLDRLRRQRKQRGLNYFAPNSPGNPFPEQWVGDGKPLAYPEFLSWAVSKSVINGNDRAQVLAVEEPVEPPKADSLGSAMQLLEDHAQLLRQAIDRLPDAAVGLRNVLRILLAT